MMVYNSNELWEFVSLGRSPGDQEKRKDRKTLKSGSEEKVIGFSSASVFPIKKWEAV